jgi:hypothetical protein
MICCLFVLVYLPRTNGHISFILTASGLYRMPECIYTCWRYLHRNNTDKLCHEWRYRIVHLSSIIAEAIVSNKNFDNEVATTSMLDWFVFRTSLERQMFKVNPDWWTNRHVHMLFGRFFVFLCSDNYNSFKFKWN